MAIVSVGEFLVFAPEFGPADNALISAKLAEAERRCPAKTWGEETDLRVAGIKNKAAQLLARHPQARELRLVNEDGKTTWDEEIARLNRIAAAGLSRTAGKVPGT